MACAVAALAGCGASEGHFEPLGDAGPKAPLDVSSADDVPQAHAREGALEVTARGAVTSYLSHLRAVLTDGRGKVVAGAEAEGEGETEEEDQGRVDEAPELRLTAPEGNDYTLTLTATTNDGDPTACHAVVGPLSVEAGAAGAVRVLAWECGETTGYVPSAVASQCFWLAEWLFVARTSAAVGEDIEVSAAGHDARGNLARFAWSAPAPSLGLFAAPESARTLFRCERPGTAQPLTVAISDAECEAQLSQNIACH